MKIYFSFSITGGRDFQPTLERMAEAMLAAGCEVPTAINAHQHMDESEQERSAQEIFQRDINWIDECDLLIAEVSTPSHGVGYEICYALMNGKEVYAFYRSDVTISKMVSGNPHPGFHLIGYNEVSDLLDQLDCLIVNCRQD